MKRYFIWMINALALLLASTAFADETTGAAAETEAVRETARVSAINTDWIMWALLIGFLIALLVTAAWKAQLKSVHSKWEAYDYVRKDSLNLSSRNERFLYRNIQKVPIPKPQNNQSGQGGNPMGGSGITFGGGAGGQGGFIVGGGPGAHGSSGGHGGISFGGSAGGQGGHGGISFGGSAGGQGGHGGFTLGGGQGSNVRPGSGNSGGGLNYGGHINPGGRPQGRGPSKPE